MDSGLKGDLSGKAMQEILEAMNNVLRKVCTRVCNGVTNSSLWYTHNVIVLKITTVLNFYF